MHLIQLLELPLFPLVFVERGVQEVDPLFPAFDFASVESLLLEDLRDFLPFFGIEGRMQF
jgi:hypothetical protein